MGTLEEVSQMKNSGMSEEEIISSLGERGVSPKEIDDALNQAEVKSAVSKIQGEEDYNDNSGQYPDMMIKEQIPDMEENDNMSGGHIKPRTRESGNIPQNQNYNQQEYPEEDYAHQPYNEQPQYSPQEEYYAPQEYTHQDYSYPNPSGGYGYDTGYGGEFSSESIIEVSEQVVNEKLSTVVDKINEINEFRTIAQSQIEHIETRLRKIESIIDRLQISILEKVGSYGENLNSIKKEMNMMQESFTKVINPLTDKIASEESSKHTLRKK